MSSFWPERRRAGLRLLALGALVVPAMAWAGPYADLDARLKGRPDAEAVAGLRKIAGEDADAQSAVDDGPAAARAYVALRASLEGAPRTKNPAIGSPLWWL